MTDANEWLGRTGQSWAEQWRRTDRSFGPLTEHLLKRTREFSFTSALDVGCGAGELALAIARGRPHVSVTGVDLAPALIEVARERASNLANVSFEHGDAAAWQPPEGSAPDLLVSRHGVMFFDDPVAAFTHLAAIAGPDAGLMFSCFRERSENPFFTEIARLLPNPEPPPPSGAPGPFAFADRSHVHSLLEAAGWTQVAFEPFDFAMIAGGGDNPVGDALEYFGTIGPAARAASELTPEERSRFLDRLRELARRNLYEGIVSLRAATWIVTARSGAS
jgi:SAM-dependent methyltransferase